MGAKYQDIAKWIKEQIDTGTIKAGDKIPSEHTLSAMFEVTRQTIRHAIKVLEDQDILEKVQGSGTYVKVQRYEFHENRTCIAFITTYVDGYIFPKIIQGIEKKLSEAGFSVQIAFTNNKFDRERAVLKDFLKREDLAGVIAEPTKSSLPNPNIAFYQELQKRQVPVLFINSFYDELDMPHVSLNDFEVGRCATKYLLSKGHTKIGGIFKSDDGQGKRRYAGLVSAMLEQGETIDDSLFLWVDTIDVNEMEFNKAKIINRLRRCSAIVCYNDEVAYECKEILQNANFRIPEDISIVSVDNAELSTLSNVAFTSIEHPKDILGKKAAENLLKMIHSRDYNATYEFMPQIVERESVKHINII